jgi:NADH-quinone oxidoreductase subunit N
MGALIAIAITGIVLLYLGFARNVKILVPVSVAGLLVAFGFTIADWNNDQSFFNHMMTTDNFSIAFNAVIIFSTVLIMLLSYQYYKGVQNHVAEIYALMFFSLFGALLITSFDNLSMLFIGIETMSIPLYILAGSKKFSIRSNEASFKYFVMGSFATAVFLLGVALIYGASGSFHIGEIVTYISKTPVLPSFFKLGVLLLLLSFAFKVGAVPFHFWVPDVYEGSPTIVSAFMATVVKTAAFAALCRLLHTCLLTIPETWKYLVLILAVLSLVVANISAIQQRSAKRMLSWSSVSHTGFMLMALLACNKFSESALLYYAFAYSLATVAAFGILILVKNFKNADPSVDAFNGLAKKNPFVAFYMAIAMLSMSGIPVTAGFFAKYYVFLTAIESGYLWLVIVGVLAALAGVAYYFRIIIAMYFKEGDTEKINSTLVFRVALVIATVLALAAGILPGFLMVI